MQRKTRAGSRTNRYRLGYGRQSDNKVAWLRTAITNQIALLAIDTHVPPDPDEESEFDAKLSNEVGMSYLMVIQIPGRDRPLTWNLTGMTSEELEATRQFFDHVFTLVDPIIRERDQVAKDAYETDGDDSYVRLYRPLPQYITRKRKVREHSEGILDGPENAAPVSGEEGSSDGGLRASGDDVADSYEEDRSDEDHNPPINLP